MARDGPGPRLPTAAVGTRWPIMALGSAPGRPGSVPRDDDEPNRGDARWAVGDANPQRVLVVPSAALDRLGRFQGFSAQADRYLRGLLVPGLAQFRPRPEVEDDPGFKQIIPYVVFRCGAAVFCYTRGAGQGEARLRRRRSLGVGGHVEEADAEGRGTPEAYEMALRRELAEEVHVGSPGRLSRVGLINDDATAVGAVHLGVVHLFELERPEVEPREEGLAEPGFVPLDELRAGRESFESWSQICLDAFLGQPA
jgi:predicted NUDIX family phosphoesterase